MKTQHTHLGTCQACGAVQAVDNSTKLVAKHGYKVAGFGFFNGICSGSGRLPAEMDTSYTQVIIVAVADHAVEQERIAALYSSGVLMVYTWDVSTWVRGTASKSGHYVTQTLPMFGCSKAQVDRERDHTVYGYENAARMARSHVDSLTKHVLPRLGQPLYTADDLKTVKPVDGKVNVKAGTIEGAFHTKAAQKSALEAIAHSYEREARVVMDACLASGTGEHGGRLPAADTLYFNFPSHAIANYRPRHSAAILAVFPELASVVTEMERLVALRLEVKGRPVVKGGEK